LETFDRVTRNKKIRMCKVQWAEATWEREEELKIEFLKIFSDPSDLEDEIHFKGVSLSHPKI
jgi:hypothetical protein